MRFLVVVAAQWVVGVISLLFAIWLHSNEWAATGGLFFLAGVFTMFLAAGFTR